MKKVKPMANPYLAANLDAVEWYSSDIIRRRPYEPIPSRLPRAPIEQFVRELVEDADQTDRVYWFTNELAGVHCVIHVTESVHPDGVVLPFGGRCDDGSRVVVVLLHPVDWSRRSELQWPPALDPGLHSYSLAWECASAEEQARVP